MTRMTGRVLVVNPYGIGDVLFTLPLLEAIRAYRPSVTLGYLCNRRTEGLVRAFPGVREVLVFEKDEFRAEWRTSKPLWLRRATTLAKAIHAGRWETAIDLSLNWQFGAALALLGIPTRVGFNFRGRGRLLTKRLPLAGFSTRPVADYYLDVLTRLGIPRPAVPSLRLALPAGAGDEAAAWLHAQGVDLARPVVALVPGGGVSWGERASYKQWPINHYAQLGDRLTDDLAAQVILLGDAADHPFCLGVSQQMRHPATILEPEPSLTLLAAILTHCTLVIGNDSGSMHLAAAVGTPSVAIFGPANAMVYGPLPSQDCRRHRVVTKTLACRPCYTQFRLPPCPWGIRCLTTLEPDEVYASARMALAT